ncbi:DUF1758 domain-containing protein, partial [Trichonephila clavipes]
VGKPIDENSACVEVEPLTNTREEVTNPNNFKNYFSSNDITCEEVKISGITTFFLHWIHRTMRATREPEEKRSENFNLFFQSLERAFLTKKINDEYKSEILINLLGERAHNVLLYIKEEELNDYEKLKSIVLREFQLTPRECLNSFKNAVKSSGETYIQFAARLTANFQYYCSLRKVNSFESLCDLIISDKLFETLNKETATHIGIREAEDWFRPIDLAKECDIYISSRSGSHKEIPITYGYTQDPFKNRSQNFKTKD